MRSAILAFGSNLSLDLADPLLDLGFSFQEILVGLVLPDGANHSGQIVGSKFSAGPEDSAGVVDPSPGQPLSLDDMGDQSGAGDHHTPVPRLDHGIRPRHQ